MRALLVALALSLLLSPPALAKRAWMTNAELRTAFSGKTIEGVYRDGRTFKEAYRANGTLDYDEGSRHLTGHWSVINGTFCTIYDGSASGGCFRVHRLSANCFEFYFQSRDEAQAADPKPGDRPSWTAQAWRTSALATCQERPTV